MDRYQGRLLSFVNRTIGDRERAEDLVQEVFIRVFRHLHRFDQTKKFSTWIYTIASNLAKNELRNRSRNPLVFFQTIKRNWEADHRPLQFEDTTARPDDLYRKRFLKDAVEQCVGQLPGASPRGVRAARARGEELRGNRGDHRLQPGHGEEPPESGSQQLRAADRTAGRVARRNLTPVRRRVRPSRHDLSREFLARYTDFRDG